MATTHTWSAMAGPTANIFLPQMSQEALDLWRTAVDGKSQLKRGMDFWVKPSHGERDYPLPFSWRVEHEDEELWIFEDQPEASSVVCEHFGFIPRASIGLSAGCRGRGSDHVLTSLAIEFLADHDGIFIFHGLLTPSLEPHAWKAWHAKSGFEAAAQFLDQVGPFEGQLVAIPIDGEPSYHAADLRFLQFWISHQAFHLVN